MKVNFYVEDMLFFRYIGCSTVAKTLYNTLRGLPGLEVTWKKYGNSADIVHYHTFGPFAGLNRRLSRGKRSSRRIRRRGSTWRTSPSPVP